ncbi:hypothetical protein WOLCODRAFT_133744 [Wolfiporia cocos MD-104 SS10]|uniref:Uncharacterized protein n=1 Tax=Wolfiporia cocos (strain MD-104) TaxID=742152 RepID=A0A2H3J8R2_WOLCO|nr:hypothetical protein WOLCODRAFT_133744 [Wolfiporia cocos MD-104 SS10]
MASSTPSFTPSAAAGTTPTSVNGNNSNNSSTGFFSANGTPALILAFLAIGLFVGGMLAMFGLRRRMVNYGPRRWFASEPPAEALSAGWAIDLQDAIGPSRASGRKKKDVGKPPLLWDMCAADNSDSMSWKDITPISARCIPQDGAENQSQCVNNTPLTHPPESRLFHNIPLDPFGLLHRSPAVPDAPPPTAVPPPPRALQVAVVIAMPTPPHSDAVALDYTLAVAELPWRGDYALVEPKSSPTTDK